MTVTVTKAVSHARCTCGGALQFPIADLASPITCAACGEEAQLSQDQIDDALAGYDVAIAEAEREVREGTAETIHLMVDAGDNQARRVN